MTPESQQRISILRAKLADGSITLAELQEGVRTLREGRANALRSSDGAKRAKAKAAIPSADDMLSELGEL